MAWLAERAARSATALVPVIGPRTAGQLDDYLAALDLTLSPAQYIRLTEVGTGPGSRARTSPSAARASDSAGSRSR